MPYHSSHKRRQKERTRLKLIDKGLEGRSVVLLGIMGAGKTVLGRRLAKRLDLPFVDSDHEVEAAAGMSVSDIFELHGEENFREGEHKVIERLLTSDQMVLATGGGAFMNDITRQTIQDEAVSIWLNAELDTIMERVLKKDTRPLLRVDDPRAVMDKLMKERYPVYAQADISVMSRNLPHHVMVSRLVDRMAGYFIKNGTVASKKKSIEQKS